VELGPSGCPSALLDDLSSKAEAFCASVTPHPYSFPGGQCPVGDSLREEKGRAPLEAKEEHLVDVGDLGVPDSVLYRHTTQFPLGNDASHTWTLLAGLSFKMASPLPHRLGGHETQDMPGYCNPVGNKIIDVD
jgi:hypothetical protein